MLCRRARIVFLPLIGIIGLVLLAGYPSAKVQADTNPVNLVLGGAGATSWNISNIKPGDSGNQTVTLHNAGTRSGLVTIWLSNLVSIEGPLGRPGKFADYLLLGVSAPGLATNLSLPVVMTSFPQTPSGAAYVRVNPLRVGDTVTLVWRWELPYQTGNDVQGNGISFSINYMLEEFPPSPPSPSQPVMALAAIPEAPSLPPPPSILQTNMGDLAGAVEIGVDGTLPKPLRLTDPSGNFILDIASGSRITGFDGRGLGRLELTITEERLVVPDNTVVVSPVYQITGYTQNMEISRINFEPFAIVTISYHPKNLPEYAFPPFIANYADGQGFVRLEPPPGAVFEVGKARGVVYYASYFFAVVTEVAPPPPPLPASFRVSNLIINPAQASLGQPVSLSVAIANDGAVAGSYQLYLVIDGIVRAVKEITLEPQSMMTVRFEVANLAAGRHQVKIAGLTGEFRIVSAIIAPAASPVNWSLIDLSIFAIVVAGLLVSYLVIRRSQRQHLGSI